MERKALIVVDVQNDFCPSGSLPVPNGDQVVPIVNKLIDHARHNDWLVLASRDSHPRITSHFNIWPKHCISGTYGSEFHRGLTQIFHSEIYYKGQYEDEDAYSAFQGRNIFGAFLAETLIHNEVEKVYIVGLATDYCVKETALDSVKQWQTYVVIDACRAVYPDKQDQVIEFMKAKEVSIVSMQEIINE